MSVVFFKGIVAVIIFLIYIFTLWHAVNLSLFSSFEWLKFRGKGGYGGKLYLLATGLVLVLFVALGFLYFTKPINFWQDAKNLTELWLRGSIYLIELGQLGRIFSDIFVFLTPQVFALGVIFISVGRILFPKYMIRHYEHQYKNIKRNKFIIKFSPAFELTIYSLAVIVIPQMILALYRIWNDQFGYFPLNPMIVDGFTLFSILCFIIVLILMSASLFIFIFHEIRCSSSSANKSWGEVLKPILGFNLLYMASWEDSKSLGFKELYTQTAANKKLCFPLPFFIYCLIEGDPICALASPKNAFTHYTQILLSKLIMRTEVSQAWGYRECKANPQEKKSIKYIKANVFYTMFVQNIDKPLPIMASFYVTGLLTVCFMPYYLLILSFVAFVTNYLGILHLYSLVWVILIFLPWLFIFYNSCEIYQAVQEYIVLKNSGYSDFIKAEILNYIYAQESPRSRSGLWGKAYFTKEDSTLYKRDIFTADPPDLGHIKTIIENI